MWDSNTQPQGQELHVLRTQPARHLQVLNLLEEHEHWLRPIFRWYAYDATDAFQMVFIGSECDGVI